MFLKFSIFFIVFNNSFCSEEENSNQKIETFEIYEVFDANDLLKDEANHSKDSMTELVHKIVFAWPVAKKLIKEVVIDKLNSMSISVKAETLVLSPHTGIVMEIDNSKKLVRTEHIVEGGICYSITFTNVENCDLKIGQVIKMGQKIGRINKTLVLEISQKDVKINLIAYMLFPPIDPQLIKIIKKVA